MFKTNIFKKADLLITDFIDNKLLDYNKLRNFDYGITSPHKAVSGLSPYISMGIINETYVLKKVIKKNIYNNKFIDEIFWRIYWRGWLERRPKVWHEYKQDMISGQYEELGLKEKLKLAKTGKTGIVPFDSWINQLTKSGYLHNHARMWFASIWIHYLGLPWQLGANFFLDNLLDGDTAVNTLSWRWVAGLQTLGKKYIATEENINKFTLNRFKSFALPKLKETKLDERKFEVEHIKYCKDSNLHENSATLILSNNINPNSILKKIKKTKILFLITFKKLRMNKSNIVSTFEDKVISEAIEFYKNNYKNFFVINLPTELEKLKKILNMNNIIELNYEYIGLGYQRDLLEDCFKKIGSNIKKNIILDELYADAWNFCDKGFFKFKENIPFILEKHIK